MTNIYIGNGLRSHRIAPTGTKTVCGIDLTGVTTQPASDGEPGCNRCYRTTRKDQP